MTKNSNKHTVILYGSLLAFIIATIYILHINHEVFYTAHNRSEFIYGSPFFDTLVSKPFGLMQYIGAWLTQYFYNPILGSTLLLVIWILIYIVGSKAFGLKVSAASMMLLPVACLLVSVVDLGYWVYILPIRGYWFSQSVAYLVFLLLMWAARCVPRQWHPIAYLLGFCLYPVLGWFALLFVLCLALSDKVNWREVIALVVIIFAAGIWHTLLYSHARIDQVTMAGFPRFITAIDDSELLSIPFWALGALSVLFTLCCRYLNKWYVPAISAVLGICFAFSLMYQDKTYIDEMRMVRSAEDDNWQEVLNVVAENPKPSSTMVLLKNIALMNEGGLLDSSFKTSNIINPICNPDSLHITLLEIASPLVYYNYGMLNEAIRLAYEDGIQDGFSPFILKVLSRCTQATEEDKLSQRYLTLLRQHPFYTDWKPAPVKESVKELANSYPDELTGIENSDSYVVNSISLWYTTDSKLASEQALFYAMIRCDSGRFWPALRQFIKLHQGENFPLHAQEAYILFMDKAPEEKRMMIPVEQTIFDRYKKFWDEMERRVKPGVNLERVAEEMRGEWGDTFWYYNIFGRKVY